MLQPQVKQALLIVLSAPSGGGKTTLTQALRKQMPQLGYSISLTTRAPRGQERDGVDYHFVSAEIFEQHRQNNALAEYAQVHGNWYGTPRAQIDQSLKNGQSLLFDIDVQGGESIVKMYPQAVLICLAPPSMQELEKRLRMRGQDSDQVIARRLAAAQSELERAAKTYHYWVVNDQIQTALEKLKSVIVAESQRLQK